MIIIPIDHLRFGDKTDHWVFISGRYNDSGKFIATWYTPSGKVRVLAHDKSENVIISAFGRN